MTNDMEEKALTPVGPCLSTEESEETTEQASQSSSSAASNEKESAGSTDGKNSGDNSAPPPPHRPMPPSWQPVRRVGTITMGLSLIAAGILILCSLLIPSFNLISAAKFAPVILVFLGLEILLRYFTSKGEKLRYDFLSGFVCLVLIIASVTVSIIPTILNYYGPQRYIVENRMEQIVYADLCDRLEGNNNVSYLEANVSLLPGQQLSRQAEQMPDEQLKSLIYDYFSVDFYLLDKFEDKNAFAEACKNIISAVQSAGYPFQSIYFHNSVYSLEVSSQLAYSMTVEDLSLQVDDHAQVEADLEERYQEGYEAGLETGDSDGYDRGYEEGRSEGYTIGYEEGYSLGLSDRQTS